MGSIFPRALSLTTAGLMALTVATFLAPVSLPADDLTDADRELVRKLERHRIAAIDRVVGSVVAIYDENRQGGGSGVIIDPSGIALTNHHVIMGAGVSGWGGLADGQLYPWQLIGTDPGGDVAIIQLEGQQSFPFTPLGNSDDVRVGDWALAMGNPFILTEDQKPTVTLGIVSGVKRYQPGAGANQLVYGNCIQVDSSINPGNSGGPLFNLHGRVIGINGRGSFQDRGRVNVGLGYAISANQIKNFIPDLLATKLVEHATLDASFSDRDGKVVCSTINRDAPIALAGLQLRDELLEFEGVTIHNANQYTNLICTLPEDWPASLKIRKPSGEVKEIHIRMLGLPYRQPPRPQRKKPGDEPPSPEEKQQRQRQLEMIEMLSAPPGEIRFPDINRKYAKQVVDQWINAIEAPNPDEGDYLRLTDRVTRDGVNVGQQVLDLHPDGRFRIDWDVEDEQRQFLFDGNQFYSGLPMNELQPMTLVEAKLSLPIIQAMAMAAATQEVPFSRFGEFLIDGSDKAVRQNAYRMVSTDEENDPFFFWLRMYDPDHGLPSPELLKVSADKNGKEGAVTFDDWQDLSGWQLPAKRLFVIQLGEESLATITNESANWQPNTDESHFSVASDANFDPSPATADKEANR